MNKKKNNFIPPSVENAIKTIKEFCTQHECRDCPLYDDRITKDKCSLYTHAVPEFWEI